MPHGHSHNPGCGHEALGIENELEMGIQYSLYEKIDMNNLECLNEESEGSGKTVFKSYIDRLNREKFVTSDADEELLFNIPFTGNVKLKGIIIIGSEDDTHPKKMRLFKNRPKMTFDDAAVPADQEFELERDTHGVIEYSTKVVSFANVHHLSIHIPCNYGSDTTTVYYVGLKGEFSEAHHHGVTICTYETRPNVSDHKNSLLDSNHMFVSSFPVREHPRFMNNVLIVTTLKPPQTHNCGANLVKATFDQCMETCDIDKSSKRLLMTNKHVRIEYAFELLKMKPSTPKISNLFNSKINFNLENLQQHTYTVTGNSQQRFSFHFPSELVTILQMRITNCYSYDIWVNRSSVSKNT